MPLINELGTCTSTRRTVPCIRALCDFRFLFYFLKPFVVSQLA